MTSSMRFGATIACTTTCHNRRRHSGGALTAPRALTAAALASILSLAGLGCDATRPLSSEVPDWQLAYAEILVTDLMWPDFDRDDLEAAILDYQSRERRYGRISAQVRGEGGSAS